MYIREAFEQVCKEAKPAESLYVVLMEDRPYYGGPQEGGWFGHDHTIVAYQLFPTEEQARAAGTRSRSWLPIWRPRRSRSTVSSAYGKWIGLMPGAWRPITCPNRMARRSIMSW
jgi:hypothetical protein